MGKVIASTIIALFVMLYSYTAIADDGYCKENVPLKLGEVSPCTGVLTGPDWNLKATRALETLPKFDKRIKDYEALVANIIAVADKNAKLMLGASNDIEKSKSWQKLPQLFYTFVGAACVATIVFITYAIIYEGQFKRWEVWAPAAGSLGLTLGFSLMFAF